MQYLTRFHPLPPCTYLLSEGSLYTCLLFRNHIRLSDHMSSKQREPCRDLQPVNGIVVANDGISWSPFLLVEEWSHAVLARSWNHFLMDTPTCLPSLPKVQRAGKRRSHSCDSCGLSRTLVSLKFTSVAWNPLQAGAISLKAPSGESKIHGPIADEGSGIAKYSGSYIFLLVNDNWPNCVFYYIQWWFLTTSDFLCYLNEILHVDLDDRNTWFASNMSHPMFPANGMKRMGHPANFSSQ